MKKLIFSFLTLICLSSCCKNSAEKVIELTPQQKTQESLNNPETIGTLPDGRVIQKVYYYRNSWSSTEIFIIGNSVSYEVPNGKFKKPTAVLESPLKE